MFFRFHSPAAIWRMCSSRRPDLPVSAPVGVSHKEDAFTPVRRSDSRSLIIEYPNGVTRSLQTRTNVVAGNSQDSSHVFTDNPTRRKFGDNAQHFGPKVAVVVFPLALAREREGLAGEPAGDEVNGSQSCFRI